MTALRNCLSVLKARGKTMLKDNILRYLEITGVTQFKFCLNCGISTTSLKNIIMYDKEVSPKIESKIYSYMSSASKELNEFVTGLRV